MKSIECIKKYYATIMNDFNTVVLYNNSRSYCIGIIQVDKEVIL